MSFGDVKHTEGTPELVLDGWQLDWYQAQCARVKKESEANLHKYGDGEKIHPIYADDPNVIEKSARLAGEKAVLASFITEATANKQLEALPAADINTEPTPHEL